MIVVDASVFAFALLDEGSLGVACRRALAEDDRWIAPEHWTIEVMSVIRGTTLGGKVTQAQADEAVAGLTQLDPVVPRTRVLLPRIWQLRGSLTAYDAAYVAAAEAYDCALKTTDGGLSRASGLRCTVDVITG